MTDKDKKAGSIGAAYQSPQAGALFIKAQGVLCGSNGNEPIREHDYGDGGFSRQD